MNKEHGNTPGRLGRLETTTDAAGLLTRTYHPASGQLAGEAYSGTGLLSGRTIARTYDARFRPESLATDSGYGLAYGHDGAGRLQTITQGFHLATYGYKANVGTVETVTIKRVGVERVRHHRTTDNLGRVGRIKTSTGATIPVQRDYTYNDANQRTQIAHEDTRLWAYGYDDLGQVTSAQKRLADNVTSLPGYNFGYTFDDIGNRAETTLNSRAATYVPNLLNQYESRTIPGAFDVRGEAHTTATVMVNNDSTTRTGKDFYREVTAANTSAPVNATIAINATEGSETVNDAVTAFLARTPESFAHDLDGNITEDGRWSCGYDAENRLISMETPTALALAFPALKKRITFAYDSQSRRIRKHVETWNALLNSGLGGWTSTADLRFIHDGWNLLTELDALNSNTVLRSHVWGLDLSRTMQGAGGVSGLLWTNTPTHTFATSADANGNIVAYINTATLAVSGRADYGAFGEIVVQTGVAKELPFGFSTKYTDRETGLNYYGFRYYNPSTGRWLSRDPIEEEGGVNLYAFLSNDGLNATDRYGLWPDFVDTRISKAKAWTKNTAQSFYNWASGANDPEPDPWQLFYNYAHGGTPQLWDGTRAPGSFTYTQDSAMVQSLIAGDMFQKKVLPEVRKQIRSGEDSGRFSASLKNSPRYQFLKDGIGMATRGYVWQDFNVSFVGSWGGTWQAYCDDNRIWMVAFRGRNVTSASSNTRTPPLFNDWAHRGYPALQTQAEGAWNNFNWRHPLNTFPSFGPFSSFLHDNPIGAAGLLTNVEQKFEFTIPVSLEK